MEIQENKFNYGLLHDLAVDCTFLVIIIIWPTYQNVMYENNEKLNEAEVYVCSYVYACMRVYGYVCSCQGMCDCVHALSVAHLHRRVLCVYMCILYVCTCVC